jgi:NADH-quinone oxidoreductase subunit N
VPLDLDTAWGLFRALLPESILTAWAMGLLLDAAWHHGRRSTQRRAGWMAALGIVAAGEAVVWLWTSRATAVGIPTAIALDQFRFAVDLVILLAALVAVLLSFDYLEREGIRIPEYYALILLGTVGMMLLAGAEDLFVLFLGLELMSVSVYVLSGLDRRSAVGGEAALKYFLLGAFASAFLLYGIAMLYGATGTTKLHLIAAQIQPLGLQQYPLLLAGLGLLLVGFGFKVAAVPFHMWTPDVYDGAPTPVTGYMATAVKAAAFAALIRVLFEAFPMRDLQAAWGPVLFGLAALTMVVGNLVALAQRSLKRMLAYSSIAHAGYLLTALVTHSSQGAAAFLFYLVFYTLMTAGAFAILALKGRDGERDVRIDDLAGLSASHPWLAFAMTVCMLSLLGFPGTAGFIGKWYILLVATGSGHPVLAVILVLTSVLSAGYYLPVVMAMYMKPPSHEQAHAGVRVPNVVGATLAVMVAALLVFGVWPNAVMRAANSGSQPFVPRPATRMSAPAVGPH